MEFVDKDIDSSGDRTKRSPEPERPENLLKLKENEKCFQSKPTLLHCTGSRTSR